jgi:flagellar export protein FliJ
MEQFLTGHKKRIEEVRLHVRALIEAAEVKQETLILAAREKKILVKLKEKRLTEHQLWLQQVEAKLSDDQTSMARAWGKR